MDIKKSLCDHTDIISEQVIRGKCEQHIIMHERNGMASRTDRHASLSTKYQPLTLPELIHAEVMFSSPASSPVSLRPYRTGNTPAEVYMPCVHEYAVNSIAIV